MTLAIPHLVPNLIAGREAPAQGGGVIEKLSPHDGTLLCKVAESGEADVAAAVQAARQAQPGWAATTAIARGKLLLDIAAAMRAAENDIAAIIAAETGKAPKEAVGEVRGAAQLAEFFAGEGMRLYGRSLQSGTPGKYTHTIRQPLGVAALIVAANTPIANVAWKVFPALICGNAAVLKMAEDTPATAWAFGLLAQKAGLPDGVLNIVQGLGSEAGQALIVHPDVNVISFTGSTAVGRRIAQTAGERLVRVSLELGGKNPLVVCDDADIDNAVKWTMLSSFSNAGQRCAASSRVIIFDSIYDEFVARLVERTKTLKIGNSDADDFGPVINARQLGAMLEAIGQATARGGQVLAGGRKLDDAAHAGGCYLAPTILAGLDPDDALADKELFGPITALYRARDFAEALRLANNTAYGLTASIHTRSLDRAVQFGQQVRAGTVNVNIGTYGSEPHFPFGGFGQSGNGTREPGVEALDVYSEVKTISFTVNPAWL
jgi:acyl-CoA reductase-like NAD-dependent aldehyde dehydrogenase